jgi:hypothetical protein
MCSHQPSCRPADRPDRDAAHTIAFHPEQGWSLLCNSVILFDDTGELLPDGRAIPRTARPTPDGQPAPRARTG